MAFHWISQFVWNANPVPDIDRHLTLIFYCSIVTTMGNHVIAEYSNGDKELARTALECIKLVPPHHDRYSFTANTRMFACLVEKSLCYCAVADEALSRSKVMFFLEDIMQEFSSYAKKHKIDANELKLQTLRLKGDFKPIFRRLISALQQRENILIEEKLRTRTDQITELEAADETEVPPQVRPQGDPEIGFQISESPTYEIYDTPSPFESPAGSRSPSSPLINKQNGIHHNPKIIPEMQTRNITRIRTDENVVNSPLPTVQHAVQQREIIPRNRCSKHVKVILLLDAIVCIILFIIWVSVCGGFECIRPNKD